MAVVTTRLGRSRPPLNRTLRRLLLGLFFVSPWLVGLIIFAAGPILASAAFSFTSYDVLTPPQWIGLGNYGTLIHDSLFWVSLSNTLYYTLLAVPLSIVVSLMLALLLNQKIWGLPLFRTFFYIPSIVPIIASSILWLAILNPQSGMINNVLSAVGLPQPGWLASEYWSKPALIMMSVWASGGSMIILLAALQGIPEHLYEAAEVDGATGARKFWRITLPLLTPTMLFLMIIGVIGAFQYFTEAYVMTGGGPVNSTLFYALYLFQNAFAYFKMGYASAMAWILFFIVLAASLAIMASSRHWVYYEGEVR